MLDILSIFPVVGSMKCSLFALLEPLSSPACLPKPLTCFALGRTKHTRIERCLIIIIIVVRQMAFHLVKWNVDALDGYLVCVCVRQDYMFYAEQTRSHEHCRERERTQPLCICICRTGFDSCDTISFLFNKHEQDFSICLFFFACSLAAAFMHEQELVATNQVVSLWLFGCMCVSVCVVGLIAYIFADDFCI